MTQNKPSHDERRRIAREKIEAYRAAEARRQRTRTLALTAGGAVAVGALAAIGAWGISGANADRARAEARQAANDPSLDKSADLLASTAHQADGQDIDGVLKSDSMEQTAYHIHSHLQVFVNGKQLTIPYGIGIVPPYQMQQAADGSPFVGGGKMLYFLHTHDETGIIHVESPTENTYTLGNLFDLWKQPLTRDNIAGHQGTETVYIDGNLYTGNPRDIVFKNKEEIQIDIGTPVPYKNWTWPSSY